jgi:hypothetical protein
VEVLNSVKTGPQRYARKEHGGKRKDWSYHFMSLRWPRWSPSPRSDLPTGCCFRRWSPVREDTRYTAYGQPQSDCTDTVCVFKWFVSGTS